MPKILFNVEEIVKVKNGYYRGAEVDYVAPSGDHHVRVMIVTPREQPCGCCTYGRAGSIITVAKTSISGPATKAAWAKEKINAIKKKIAEHEAAVRQLKLEELSLKKPNSEEVKKILECVKV